MKMLIVLLALTSAVPAVAGIFDQGNGGHVVVCAKGSRHAHPLENGVAVLDLFESNRAHGWMYEEFAKLRSKNLETTFRTALGKFLRLDPIETAELLRDFANFRKEVEFVPSLGLSPAAWTFVKLPPGCELQQGALQYVDSRGFGRHRLVLSRAIWTRMDNAQRAALLFHEYIYRRLRLAHGDCAYGAIRQTVGFGLSDRNLRSRSRGLDQWRDFTRQYCPPPRFDEPAG